MTSKRCAKCGEKKDAGQFHKASQHKDGIASYCKTCVSVYGKKWYSVHGREGRKKYDEIEKLRRFVKKYDDVGEDLDDFIGKQDACRAIFTSFIGSGRIRRPKRCEECGKECEPNGHHTDYSRPLLVVWLCEKCHWKQHPKKG